MKTLLMSTLFLSVLSTHASAATDITAIFNKLDSECSGNDSGYIGKFDVLNFSASEVKKKLSKRNGDCRSNVSSSKKEGVAAALFTLFSPQSEESACVMGALTASEQKKLKAFIQDPSNLGVFSKEWDGDSGDSEYCLYANYDIYRADGTVMSIVFNHTD